MSITGENGRAVVVGVVGTHPFTGIFSAYLQTGALHFETIQIST